MTEDEAKTKWCPHVRVMGFDEEGPGNSWERGNVKPMGSGCIASGCMAWRWYPNWGDSPENPDACTELPPIEGFCGLAGRP